MYLKLCRAKLQNVYKKSYKLSTTRKGTVLKYKLILLICFNFYCQLQVIHKIFKELVNSLRKWFNSICNCDGHNNLRFPNLTCINEQTGIITSEVHRDGLLSAQQLIDLARTDINSRNPPVVHLSRGWILCLNISSKSETKFDSNTSSTSIALPMLIIVSVAAICTILALLLCIVIGMVYMKYRRYSVFNCT